MWSPTPRKRKGHQSTRPRENSGCRSLCRCGVAKAKIGKQSRRLIECLRQISDFMCRCGGSRESLKRASFEAQASRPAETHTRWAARDLGSAKRRDAREILFGRLSRLKDEDITHLEPPWENVRR